MLVIILVETSNFSRNDQWNKIVMNIIMMRLMNNINHIDKHQYHCHNLKKNDNRSNDDGTTTTTG